MSNLRRKMEADAAAHVALDSAGRALDRGDGMSFRLQVQVVMAQLEVVRGGDRERILRRLIDLSRRCPPSRQRDALLARAEQLLPRRRA
jgi:hypothetical protein